MKVKSKIISHSFINGLVKTFPKLISFRMPSYIIIEASNRCMLKCPICLTSHGMRRPKGDMEISIFESLLSKITWPVKMFSFSFAGEPLMNTRIFEMVHLAKIKKNIPSSIETNGMLLHNFIKDIFYSNLKQLTIALDGTDQNTLNQYRIGADFNAITSSLIDICSYKKKHKIRLPKIILQFLVMSHNENQINDFIEFAKNIEADEVVLKSLNLNLGYWLSDQQKENLAERYLPKNKDFLRYKRTKEMIGFKAALTPLCYYILTSPAVLWNGDVILCCSDFDGKYKLGNILEKSLRDIWKDKKVETLRKDALNRNLDICKECTFTDFLNKHIILNR